LIRCIVLACAFSTTARVLAAQEVAPAQIMQAIAATLRTDGSPVYVGVASRCTPIMQAAGCAAADADVRPSAADDARALARALGARFADLAADDTSRPRRSPRPSEPVKGPGCVGVPLDYVAFSTTGIVEVAPGREWRVPITALRMRPVGCSGSLAEGDYVVRRADDGQLVVRYVGRLSAMIE
jgi:hypothetical protein